MRRVVITGIGIVSSIGNNSQEVLASLREAKSGIVKAEIMRASDSAARSMALPRSILTAPSIAGFAASWAMAPPGTGSPCSRRSPISGLEESDVKNDRTGIIMGSGGPSTRTIVSAADTTREKGPKRVGPFAVPAAMSSTNSATLAVPFGISGVNYSISSACATSAHCIGNSAELIQWGKQDVMFAGGGEELDWTLSVLFDAMGAHVVAIQRPAGRGFPRL